MKMISYKRKSWLKMSKENKYKMKKMRRIISIRRL